MDNYETPASLYRVNEQKIKTEDLATNIAD
jgi:hypothetical protein